MPPSAAIRPYARRMLAAPLVAFISFPGLMALNASSPAESISKPDKTPARLSFERQYKASAYITVLSVPIFSRAGVGFGFAAFEEQVQSGLQLFSLRFLSGSTPERAHGLNRFGFIQENAQQRDHTIVAVDYFGLITANGEESISDARAALDSRTSEQVPFVAARASVSRDNVRYSLRHILLPASYRGSNAGQLLRQVEAEFATFHAGQIDKTETWKGQAIGTFLCSLREAIQVNADAFESRIVFNGKTLRFQASKRLDTKAGLELHRAGVTALPDAIMRLNGTLHNEKTNEITNFRLWFERGATNFLPLRFEFKPKSYLRLVFDAEPPAS